MLGKYFSSPRLAIILLAVPEKGEAMLEALVEVEGTERLNMTPLFLTEAYFWGSSRFV